MGLQKKRKPGISRRDFLGSMRWAPMVFLPAPLRTSALPSLGTSSGGLFPDFPFADYRFTPHYPKKSPLDDVLRFVNPGTDQYVTEKYAEEIGALLAEWAKDLRSGPPTGNTLAKFLDERLQATALIPEAEKKLNSTYGLDVFRRTFSQEVRPGRERFIEEIRGYLSGLASVETAEFQIVGVQETQSSPLHTSIQIRYDLVGARRDGGREERIGRWLTEWWQEDSGTWKALRWTAAEETLSRARQSFFVDVSSQALGHVDSYKKQLLRGVDYWRTVLDGATGIDVYGNNGIAAGDYDNNGFDDLYICQPPGLPNRLYRNRGDGTFEDVTETAGVGVLDGTACALFADFENKGLQDLLVVCAAGPLLFLNQGNGKFSLKRNAFRFANPPAGTFTHAALADYDGDGRLDVYFCLYSYYLGLDQYHYPAPYFDARNGPPNFLLHNEGNADFMDRTQDAGLQAENDRYSFACAWGDYNADGHPDLYVANDFGRSNLYRNNGDGTFSAVSGEARANDVGAGMSASWLDSNNDGKQDIYVSNMWTAAGARVSQQKWFHEMEPEEIRANYNRHMRGNWLYRNLGDGKFQNVSGSAGVEMGRWAWSSDSWDFDHDGYPDLYVANGYISGPDIRDVSSFFWRQVVANSPSTAIASENYERGWNAINELIRSDATWSGYERNVHYLNNRDGTFSEISGTLGLDFPDDSRAFALADLDQDGRLEVILKNRNAPQLRILRNAMKELGAAIVFRLRGTKSNRDAIGASVTVESSGLLQTKFLQAGTGFLSQHSKELFFGVGQETGPLRASIRWPSGLIEVLENLAVNQRIDVQEGLKDFKSKPFGDSPAVFALPGEHPPPETLPASVETWLIQPLAAPDFTLPDLSGEKTQLSTFRRQPLLLYFWSTTAPASVKQIRLLQKGQTTQSSRNVRVLCVNLDDPRDLESLRSFAIQEKISLPILLATADVAGVYNIFYRYLFDRRRDLALPSAFLLNREGLAVKVYQGEFAIGQIVKDIAAIPQTRSEFQNLALPLPGTSYLSSFQRNDFTYGVAFFQRGYLDSAAAAFQQVIASKPDEPEAYYNLGTLDLTRNDLKSARRNLEQAVNLRPGYAEAWNNLGMVSAQQGQESEAIEDFQKSLQLRPTYVTALLNFGNLLRRKGDFEEAQKLLSRALEAKPDDADANYSMGMLYARQNELSRSSDYLERAVQLRPDHTDALNNLGVLLVRQGRYSEAREKFEACIRIAPKYDQAYLNLARLYVVLNDKEGARTILQELLREQPGNKLAEQTLEMLN
jgi:FimV-like protein